MDPRRCLIVMLAALSLEGCAALSGLGLRTRVGAPPPPALRLTEAGPAAAASLTPQAPALVPPHAFVAMAPIPDPVAGRATRPRPRQPRRAQARLDPSGPPAIAAANAAAREPSQAQGFLGGVQVFAYAPGRVYDVWTAPLRVTTLTLSPGETVISKAAGDTVRWQIGETQSGEGPSRRAHVMIKPLQRGLETNLVLATSRRVYLVELRSGDPDAFNAVVTWDAGALVDAPQGGSTPAAIDTTLVAPQGPLDARYKIIAKGHRPPWAPSAVVTDRVHTFLAFPPGLAAGETPALVAKGPDGEAQVVNYRQQGGLWVVDRVLDTAELRLGGRKAQVVRIEREGGVP